MYAEEEERVTSREYPASIIETRAKLVVQFCAVVHRKLLYIPRAVTRSAYNHALLSLLALPIPTHAQVKNSIARSIMSFAKVSQGLHLVTLLWSLVEVHSQTTTPFISFRGNTLVNHSYVDFTQVGRAGDGSDSIRCRSELEMCCRMTQGNLRGDWFFPSGDVLPFPGAGDPYESRGAQAVDLRRTTALSPSGIYRCDIAFDSEEPLAREIFYVGEYNNGGIYRRCLFFIFGTLYEKVHYFTLMQVTSPYLMV